MSGLKVNTMAERSFARSIEWYDQQDYRFPTRSTDGQTLTQAPTIHIWVRLRESAHRKVGRIDVKNAKNAEDYKVEVEGKVFTIISNDSNVDTIVKQIRDEINGNLASGNTDGVLAKTVDDDGDGTADRVRLESNWTVIDVSGPAQNNTDYSVTIDGTTSTINSDNNATTKGILQSLETDINNQSALSQVADATFVDTGDFLFIDPLQGDFDISVSSNLTIVAEGSEADNPQMGIPSSESDLTTDVDAETIDDVRLYAKVSNTGNGNANPSDWTEEKEYQNVSHRGLHKQVRNVGGVDRFKLNIVNNNEGSIREALIGVPVQESD